jgi:hypothetical protein
MDADLAAGRGLVLIDGKADTARTLMSRIPSSRLNDVICLDCASDGRLPGLQFMRGTSPELVADVVLGVFSDLFRSEWGPLSERYLRAGLVAVAHDPHGTLADVPFVFTDAAYRRKLLGRIQDPLTNAVFAGFDAMKAGERQQQLAAPLGKLGQLLGRPAVRTVLGQTNPQLEFARALSGKAIICISLAPTRIGAPAARLVGALSVFALFQAVLGRSGLPAGQRPARFIYLDEPKALGDHPMPLDTLLEQARGLGVGLTLAPQSMAQLPKVVKDAALTNVATRIVFRQDSQDAQLLARDLAGVTPEDLGDLAAFEAVARIGLGPGDLAPPVTIRATAPTKNVSDPETVRAASEQRHGRSLADVDADLEQRHKAATEPVVGRKPRSA